jgi:8-hydroxy-5-deazaflavin:NADPH oxidoreductase
MSEKTSVAIIGTGNVGQALGRRLAVSGCEVWFGARAGKDLTALLADIAHAGGTAHAALPEVAAARAQIVFLAVPDAAAVSAASGLGSLVDKILVDCTNPVRWSAGPTWSPPSEGSVAQALAAALPGCKVVKAFNGFGAEFHANPELPGGVGVSVFMAGDDPDAKANVARVAEQAGFTPIDAGPLRNAGLLENAAVLWIHLAIAAKRGRNIALQLVQR